MAFSSRLKRKIEAVSAAHNRASRDPEAERLLRICVLQGSIIDLLSAMPANGDERDAVWSEIREIQALISELRNG